MAAPEAPDLGELTVYGRFLALEIEGKVHKGAGEGVVKAIGVEVRNYTLGRILAVGDVLLFREGTQVDFAGSTGHELVFVAMDDVLAIVETPPVAGLDLPEGAEGKPA